MTPEQKSTALRGVFILALLGMLLAAIVYGDLSIEMLQILVEALTGLVGGES